MLSGTILLYVIVAVAGFVVLSIVRSILVKIIGLLVCIGFIIALVYLIVVR